MIPKPIPKKMEAKTENIYLQWIMDGPKQGLIVETTGQTKDDDTTFYELSDGSRVNVDMVGKVIKQISDPDNPYSFEKIVHEATPMKEIKGADDEVYYAPDESLSLKERTGWTETKIIPPRKLGKLPKPQLLSNHHPTLNYPGLVSKPVISDPFLLMMDQVKSSTETIYLQISTEMLPKDFFQMNAKYMEDGEDKMVKFMLNKVLNEENLKFAIEESIKTFYELKKD